MRSLSAWERELLDSSIKARAQRKRLRRLAIVGAVAALGATLFAGWVSYRSAIERAATLEERERDRADTEQRRVHDQNAAEAERLFALAQREKDPGEALTLAGAAVAVCPEDHARLPVMIGRLAYLALSGPIAVSRIPAIDFAVLSPGGDRLVAVQRSPKQLTSYSVRADNEAGLHVGDAHTVGGDTPVLGAVTISEDGHCALLGFSQKGDSAASSAIRWALADLTGGKPLLSLLGTAGSAIDFTSDSRVVYAHDVYSQGGLGVGSGTLRVVARRADDTWQTVADAGASVPGAWSIVRLQPGTSIAALVPHASGTSSCQLRTIDLYEASPSLSSSIVVESPCDTIVDVAPSPAEGNANATELMVLIRSVTTGSASLTLSVPFGSAEGTLTAQKVEECDQNGDANIVSSHGTHGAALVECSHRRGAFSSTQEISPQAGPTGRQWQCGPTREQGSAALRWPLRVFEDGTVVCAMEARATREYYRFGRFGPITHEPVVRAEDAIPKATMSIHGGRNTLVLDDEGELRLWPLRFSAGAKDEARVEQHLRMARFLRDGPIVLVTDAFEVGAVTVGGTPHFTQFAGFSARTSVEAAAGSGFLLLRGKTPSSETKCTVFDTKDITRAPVLVDCGGSERKVLSDGSLFERRELSPPEWRSVSPDASTTLRCPGVPLSPEVCKLEAEGGIRLVGTNGTFSLYENDLATNYESIVRELLEESVVLDVTSTVVRMQPPGLNDKEVALQRDERGVHLMVGHSNFTLPPTTDYHAHHWSSSGRLVFSEDGSLIAECDGETVAVATTNGQWVAEELLHGESVLDAKFVTEERTGTTFLRTITESGTVRRWFIMTSRKPSWADTMSSALGLKLNLSRDGVIADDVTRAPLVRALSDVDVSDALASVVKHHFEIE